MGSDFVTITETSFFVYNIFVHRWDYFYGIRTKSGPARSRLILLSIFNTQSVHNSGCHRSYKLFANLMGEKNNTLF